MDSILPKTKRRTEDVPVITYHAARSRIAQHHADPRRAERFARAGFRTHAFYTEDSRRYISPQQRRRVQHEGVQIYDPARAFDTVTHRFYVPQPAHIYFRVPTRHFFLAPMRTALSSWRGAMRFAISPQRAWNLSLAVAMVFGMISMAAIYRSFGVPAFATEPAARTVHEGERSTTQNRVATLRDVAAQRRAVAAATHVMQSNAQHIGEAQDHVATKDPAQVAFEERARAMVAGYPIEKMLPALFKQDRVVAAYMIAIAKQESQWGKRVPVLNGQDCYNYWGFRAKRKRMGTGGHTCFDSPEDAVETVGRRVHELVYKYKRNTADRLIIWKCGYSCAGHDPHNVASWKRTVAMYYRKLMAS